MSGVDRHSELKHTFVVQTNWRRKPQWLRGRASDSQLREPEFKSCAAVLKPGQVFSLYVAPVHSAI